MLFVDESVKLAADHFRKRYIASKHIVSPDEWPPYQPKHYTTLALIHVEEHTSTEVITVTKELASKGKIENKNESILKCHDDNICYQSKSISELFSNNLPTGRYLILIEGAPGIGKTVLSKELVFQWASNNVLNNKKLVFLVFLRDLKSKNVNTLEDLMAHVFNVNLTNDLAKYLFETNGKDITIILDGYDEMSEEDRRSSFIAKIINFTVLLECGLVITSRPTASIYLHNIADCRVEILGFTEADRLDYIQHALQGNDDKIERVKSYLESHSTINALCYIPLNMTILLSLFEETPSQTNIGRLPNTQTEMIEKFISTTITRFLKKVLQTDYIPAPELSDLPQPHDKVFDELSKLAYDDLIKDQIVFTKTEITKACPHLIMRRDNWNGLGLLKAAQHGNDSVSFHFLHFSIQEYMAAYYIASLSDKKQLKLLKNTFWDIRYFNTWIMYVGITHGESFAWKHYLSGNWFHYSTRVSNTFSMSKTFLHNKVKCLHLFQCFIEGNVEQLAKSFFQDRIIDLSNQTLQPKDVNILGFFLLRTINKHWKRIDLSRCNLRDVGCIALCKMFADKSNREMLQIDEVDFSYNHLQACTISTLLDVFKSWNTTDVIICNKRNAFFTPNEELEYFEEIILNVDVAKKFQSISIGQSLFGNKATQTSILNHLSRSVDFTALYLNDCIWQENTSLNREIVDLIRKQKLSKIHIIGKTNSYCIKGIAETIKQAETVFIYDETLADTEVDKIGNVLLYKANISDVAIVIGRNKIMGKLHTSSLNKKLSSSEINHVFSNIENLCSNPIQPLVNYFKLEHSSYGSEHLHDLFILLQNNPKLCQLSICLVEDYVLVAHKCKYEDIIATLYNHPSLDSVYVGHCDFFKNVEFNKFIDLVCKQKLLVKCYILNSSLETDLAYYACLHLVRPYTENEEFSMIIHSIHPSCEISSFFNCDYLGNVYHSTILITKDAIAGHRITYEPFSLALQLQPQVTSWKFWNCQLDCEMLDFMNSVQPVETNHLTELEFAYCSIYGNNKFQVLKNTQNFTCLTRFNVSGFKCFWNIVEEMALFLHHNTQLKELDVSNLELDLKDFKVLIESLKSHSNLTKLNISNIGTVLDEDIAIVLSNNINIEELVLSGLKICKLKPFQVIANSMKTFLCLKKLDISNNNITADIIGDILFHNTTLEHLNLSNLSLCLEDFMNISQKANNIASLRSLDVSRNSACCHNKDSSEVTDNTNGYIYLNTYYVAAVFLHSLKLEVLNLSHLHLSSDDFVNIATAISNFSNLRQLDISNNEISDKATNVLVTLLNHNISLEILDISDNRFYKAKNIVKVGKALQKLPNLTKLNICHCDRINNNAVNALGHAAILLHNSNLKEIKHKFCGPLEVIENIFKSLNHYKFTDKQKEIFIKAFFSNNNTLKEFRLLFYKDPKAANITGIFKSMTNISTLKFIKISNSACDQAANAIAQVLANNKQLEEIDLCNSDLRPIGAIKIFNGMKNLSNLIKLDVSRNDIADEEAYEGTEILAPIVSQISHLSNKPVTYTAVQRLAFVLDHNPKLQKLGVSSLHLYPEEVTVLLKGMTNLKNLVKLDISSNCIRGEAAKALASILSCNISLQKLILQKCFLQYEGAMDIFNAITTYSRLRYLDVSSNDISNEAAKALASILSCNINLQKLILQKCSLRTEGTVDIFNAITTHSRLSYLDATHNDNIGDEAAVALRAVLSNNSKLQYRIPHHIQHLITPIIKEDMYSSSMMQSTNIVVVSGGSPATKVTRHMLWQHY